MTRPAPSIVAAIAALALAPIAAGQCLEQRIDNPAPAEGAEFGAGVWLEDGTLLVGGVGGLHAYKFDGIGWVLSQTIDGAPGLGTNTDRVDFDGKRIIAGASREAFTFVRQDGRFVLEQRLDQPHPDAYSFGQTVAIEGDIAVVAETDVSDFWVYKREADGWRPIQFVERPAGLIEASTFPRYLYNLEFEDGWLFISASNADRAGVRRAGVVVAYRLQPDGTFANPQVIAAPDPVAIEEIDRPVMRNGVLAVTSRGVDASATDQIVAHTFRLVGDTWVYDHPVRGEGTGDRLYATIALSDDASQMLVSDRDRARAYAFERGSDGRFRQVAQVGAGVGLGYSQAGMASDGRIAFLGAPRFPVDGLSEVGAVAVVDTLCERCTADLTVDGRADTADLLAFLNLYELQDPAADFDGDGVLTPLDLDVFQVALDAGCPPRPTGCQPRVVQTIDDLGPIGDVLVDGDLAYAHSATRGFLVLDVADPTAPELLGSLPASDFASPIAVQDGIAYFAGPAREIVIADVRDPRRPSIINTVVGDDEFFGAVISGDTLAARLAPWGAEFYDLSDLLAPERLTSRGGNDFAGRDGLFFVSTGYELMQGSMAVLGEDLEELVEFPLIGEGLSIALGEDRSTIYTSSWNFRGGPPVGNFLTAFDVTDPARTHQLGRIAGGTRFAMIERNGFLYAADRSGVYVYDVRDPSTMELKHYIPTPARDVALIGHSLWAFGDDASLYVVDVATCLPCRADLDGDGQATLYDVLAFLRLYEAGDPSADFNQDGRLSIVDLLGFQRAVDAGCE